MSYSITPIDLLLGGTINSAQSINNSGDVVGSAEKVLSITKRVERAIQWHRFMGVHELPVVAGMSSTSAKSISNTGLIAGSSVSGDGGDWQIVWANGNVHYLSIPNINKRISINNSGLVVGTFFSGHKHAYGILPLDQNKDGNPDTWNEGRNLDGNNDLIKHLALFDPNSGLGGGTLNEANSINNKNQIAGAGEGINGALAVLYDYNTNTEMQLGNLGGMNAISNSVNEFGAVTGMAETGNEEAHAFIWLQNSSYGLPAHQMIDITPQSNNAVGLCINRWGRIVGRAHFPGQAGVSAFIWEPFTNLITDLNTLIPLNSGWHLTEATGINDQGEIVGNGVFNGAERGFQLNPRDGDTGQMIIAQVVQILFGVIDDTVGWAWGPHGTIRVPPHNPMNLISIPTKDILIGALLNEISTFITNGSVRKKMQQTNLEAIRSLVNEQINNLKKSK